MLWLAALWLAAEHKDGMPCCGAAATGSWRSKHSTAGGSPAWQQLHPPTSGFTPARSSTSFSTATTRSSGKASLNPPFLALRGAGRR